MLSLEEYRYLYGKLNTSKIPSNIMNKINEGEEFSKEEENVIKQLICEDKKLNKLKSLSTVLQITI